jgi:hypothetical protein
MLSFKLKDAHNVPDTTQEFGGVAGGQTPRGEILPPIVFPKAPINITSPKDPKVQGSATGQLVTSVTGSDSSSDSWEEEDIADVDLGEDERTQRMVIADTHKLRKLRQAVVKGLGITIEIRGGYMFEGREHEVVFSKEVKVYEPPSHLIVPYQLAFKQIEQIGLMYQGGLPASCVWATEGVSREDIDIAVFKLGQGVYVRYGHRESSALNMMNLPERVRAELPLDWSVSFGTSESPVDQELTNRMVSITTSAQDGRFWQIHLLKLPLRSGDLGTPAARVCKAIGQWDDFRCIQTAPMCAKEMPTFMEATRVKETQALLRFGRDSNWPLKVTFATLASLKTSLAITYDINWDGLQNSDEESISSDWCWGKFMRKVSEENLTAPPAFLRQGVEWRASVRKENREFGHRKTQMALPR